MELYSTFMGAEVQLEELNKYLYFIRKLQIYVLVKTSKNKCQSDSDLAETSLQKSLFTI